MGKIVGSTSNDLLVGAPEGLKTHAHFEQAQPIKRSLWTYTISRGMTAL